MIKTLTSRLAAWRRYREAVRELSALSDRELDDLGIGRSDIDTVVRQGDAAPPVAALRGSDRPDMMAPSWAAHNRRSLAA